MPFCFVIDDHPHLIFMPIKLAVREQNSSELFYSLDLTENKLEAIGMEHLCNGLREKIVN